MTNEIITFTTGQLRAIQRIIINQDDICENSPNEYFFSNIVLNSGQPPINLIRRHTASIVDDTNEPECHGRKRIQSVYNTCVMIPASTSSVFSLLLVPSDLTCTRSECIFGVVIQCTDIGLATVQCSFNRGPQHPCNSHVRSSSSVHIYSALLFV